MKKTIKYLICSAALIMLTFGFGFKYTAFTQNGNSANNAEIEVMTDYEQTVVVPSAFLGIIKNGKGFIHEGKSYENYENGYAFTSTTPSNPAEYTTYFGKNISLADGELKIELVDLTKSQIGKGLAFLPGDFEGSYTLPLGGDVSKIKQAFGDKYQELIAAGFNMGTTHSGVKTFQGVLVQEYKFSDSFADWNVSSTVAHPGYAQLMYNSVTGKCYLFKDQIARSIMGSDANGQMHRVGPPISDEFQTTIAGVEYNVQNFSSGYLRAEAAFPNDSALPYMFMNVTADGYETQLTDGSLGGQVGTVYEKYNNYNNADREYIGAVFAKEYQKILATGYNPGMVRNYVEDVQGVLLQFYEGYNSDFSSGVSAYDLHMIAFNRRNYPNLSMLVYNPNTEQVYVLKNRFLTQYVAEYDPPNVRFSYFIRDLGAPVGNQFADGGKLYQNFELGYITSDVAGTTSSVILNKNFAGGAEVAIGNKTYLGVVGASVTLPDGMTAQNLGAMFSDKYESIKKDYDNLTPVSVIKSQWTMGIKAILQPFTYTVMEGGETSVKQMAFSFDPQNRIIRIIESRIYADYTKSIYLGGAVSEMNFTGGVERQIFEHGYIDMVSGKPTVKAGYYYNTVSREFLNENYVDKVGVIGTEPGKDPVDNATSFYSQYNYKYENITAAMKKCYLDFRADGYNIGIPDESGVLWNMTGRFGLVVQKFVGGDSTNDYAGRSQMICYDPQLDRAYLVSGAIFEEYSKNLPMIVGLPAGNAYTAKDGIVAQNFYGPMGDFHYMISKTGKVEFFEGAFSLNDYEAGI